MTLLSLVLLAIGLATACLAGIAPKHTCFFDVLDSQNKLTYTATQTPSSTASKTITLPPDNANSVKKASLWTAYQAVSEYERKESRKPLRIAFSANDLKDKQKYCDAVGSQRSDPFGISVACQKKDVLTGRKKKHLYQVVRSAIAVHTSRLNVTPINGKLTVPELSGAFCSLFAVPKDHKEKGVSDADMVLYVSSFPSSKAEMFAAGAPCALLQSDKRPVVGVLTFITRHIAPTLYSVRVAMHEIAHALGFTYKIMKDRFKMKIREKRNVRHKEKVTEVQTPAVIHSTMSQFNCQDSSVVTGMELEDEAGILNVTSRSHWERRNAMDDMMAGIVTTGTYSYLTLAAFQDMGVYEADLLKGEYMDWGFPQGCNFLTKRCFGDQWANNWMFCGVKNAKLSCASGRRAMGRCSPLEAVENLPKKYNYFEDRNDSNLTGKTGEAKLLTDRCPIFLEDDEYSCTKSASKADGLKGSESWCMHRGFTKSMDYSGYFKNDAVCAKMTIGEKKHSADLGGSYGEQECKDCVVNISTSGDNILFLCPHDFDVRNSFKLQNVFLGQSNTDDLGHVVETLVETETKTESMSPTKTLSLTDALPKTAVPKGTGNTSSATQPSTEQMPDPNKTDTNETIGTPQAEPEKAATSNATSKAPPPPQTSTAPKGDAGAGSKKEEPRQEHQQATRSAAGALRAHNVLLLLVLVVLCI